MIWTYCIVCNIRALLYWDGVTPFITLKYCISNSVYSDSEVFTVHSGRVWSWRRHLKAFYLYLRFFFFFFCRSNITAASLILHSTRLTWRPITKKVNPVLKKKKTTKNTIFLAAFSFLPNSWTRTVRTEPAVSMNDSCPAMNKSQLWDTLDWVWLWLWSCLTASRDQVGGVPAGLPLRSRMRGYSERWSLCISIKERPPRSARLCECVNGRVHPSSSSSSSPALLPRSSFSFCLPVCAADERKKLGVVIVTVSRLIGLSRYSEKMLCLCRVSRGVTWKVYDGGLKEGWIKASMLRLPLIVDRLMTDRRLN